jgi:hypothetical protein
MKTAGLFSLLSLLLFTSSSVAWPWQGSHEDISGLILRRQNAQSSNSQSSSPSTTADRSSAQSSASTSNGKTTDNASASGSATDGSAAATTTGGFSFSNSTTTHATKTTAIDPRLPPGGIEMVTPAAIAPSQYYKIGDYVTFAWNYTSLSVTPSGIDILASCSLNQQLYTIALNQSVGPTGAVTWDTGEYQATATIPLLTETYTLVIYDAAQDITSIPQAGYLAVQEQFQFGMYSPQPYTPLNEFKCATCGAAVSAHERQAFGLLLGMSVITFLSFTWFASGFGVFS